MKEYSEKDINTRSVMDGIKELQMCINGTMHEGSEVIFDELCDWLEWRISDDVWYKTKLNTASEYNDVKINPRSMTKQLAKYSFDLQLLTLAKTVVEMYKGLEYKNEN
jgi:hypothetical protein